MGHEKTSFRIHSSAIAEQSDALNNLINGAMIEAQVGRVVWDDLSVNTFIRFIQFAYLGDYPTPASIPLTQPTGNTASVAPLFPASPTFTFFPFKSPTIPTEASPFKDPSWTDRKDRKDVLPQMSKIKQDNTPTKTSENKPFKDLDYPARIPAMEFFKSCKPRPNQPSEDFTPVFIAHAELYVFAEKYGIKTLKQTTLHKLHKTLAIYKMNPADIRPIIELIRYTFSEDNTLDQENHVDDLRELVIAYITGEIKTIGKCPQFLILLEEGGAFVGNVWLTVMKQIS